MTADNRLGRAWMLAGALCVITIFAYLPVFGSDFVAFDDMEAIVANPSYNPPSLGKLAHYWAEPYPDLYHPILWTVWGLISFVARSSDANGAAQWDALPFHVFNLAAHLAAAVLAMAILRRLTRSDGAGFFGALVFALHPLQVESVAWVSGMKTPLSAVFALWAVWQYLNFSDLSRPGPESSPRAQRRRGELAQSIEHRRKWLQYGLATLAFIAALLTKPTLVVLPLIVAAIEVLLRRRRLRELLLPLGIWLGLSLSDGLINAVAQSASLGPSGATASRIVLVPPLAMRPLVAADAMTFYLSKLFIPIGLIPDYGRTPGWAMAHAALRVNWLPVAPLLLLAAAVVRRAPWVAAGVLIFVLGGITTLGLVPFAYQVYSTVADRYAYFSLLGPALVGAFAVRAATARWGKPIAFGSATLPIGIMGVLTLLQCGHWRDSATLFDYTGRLNPHSLVAYRSLVFNAARAGDLPAATQVIDRGLRDYPADPALLQWQGILFMNLGNFPDAIAAFRAGRAAGINLHDFDNLLGAALTQAGQLDEALAAYELALREKPDFADVYANLGNLYALRKDWGRAAQSYQKAIDLDPGAERARQNLRQIQARRAAMIPTAPAAQPFNPQVILSR